MTIDITLDAFKGEPLVTQLDSNVYSQANGASFHPGAGVFHFYIRTNFSNMAQNSLFSS